MTEINIEQGKPYVEDALRNLDTQIDKSISLNRSILVIIHGYGSTGKGGAIGKETRKVLQNYEKDGKIDSVMFGEDFNMFNDKARKLKDKDNELLKYYGKNNYGITIIEL